jgi:hypothetical protein
MDQGVVEALGCSSVDDYDCLCTKGSQMQSLVKQCVIDKCGYGTAASIPGKAAELCACVRAKGDRNEL